jgi:3-hydroxybutyryl-CoA dehydratase
MNGPEVASVERRLTQTMLNAYADASGDHNPIHIDESFAKTTPMGGTIAHGMLVLSFISEMMAGAFGERWLASGSLDVRFRAPARPGDTVTARATQQEPKDGRLRYAVECVSQSGEALITGTAEVDEA